MQESGPGSGANCIHLCMQVVTAGWLKPLLGLLLRVLLKVCKLSKLNLHTVFWIAVAHTFTV